MLKLLLNPKLKHNFHCCLLLPTFGDPVDKYQQLWHLLPAHN